MYIHFCKTSVILIPLIDQFNAVLAVILFGSIFYSFYSELSLHLFSEECIEMFDLQRLWVAEKGFFF